MIVWAIFLLCTSIVNADDPRDLYGDGIYISDVEYPDGKYRSGDEVWIDYDVNAGWRWDDDDKTCYAGCSIRPRGDSRNVIDLPPQKVYLRRGGVYKSVYFEWVVPNNPIKGDYEVAIAVWDDYDSNNDKMTGLIDREPSSGIWKKCFKVK